ncbi:hypothetical protein SI90_05615 [Akkermansia muciniphila]|jgi:hypothetical protein|nr:hypothetical protein C1O57_11405 [Akkermansia muciniphila]QAR50067.1 hypothetical protein SI90_05615 [Akkermansia muciniphila]
MAFPFSSRSFARGGPEAEGRKRFLLSVEWLKMNRKRSNELREQVRATVSFFETAPVFFPVLQFMLVNHVAAVNAGLLPVCPENGCPAGKIPLFFRFLLPGRICRDK